jgi:hypothetical protein
MTRRRLLLIAASGLAAAAVFWAYAAWSQYRLERQLAGRWEPIEGPEIEFVVLTDFLPDGELRYWTDRTSAPSTPSAFWSVSGREMTTSDEPQRLLRATWPLARLVGWRPKGLYTYRYELAGDRLTIFGPSGPEIYARRAEP